MSKKIWIIHGPNLNLLGRREPEKYGFLTLKEIQDKILEKTSHLSLDLKFFQFNSEGEIIGTLHRAQEEADGLVINPAAYSHTSLAIHDALVSLEIPVVEVHLTNLFGREPRRTFSLTGQASWGVVMGMGWISYWLGILAILERMQT